MFAIVLLFLAPAFADEPAPAAPAAAASPVPALAATEKEPSFFASFRGGMTHGQYVGAANPKDGYASMNTIPGYFFGVGLQYAVIPEFHLFIDGNATTEKMLLADEGGNASSSWIFEQSGYSSHEVGPFPTDLYFYMETAGFRLGGKYYVLSTGSFRPFLGAAYGLYRWTLTYGNGDRTKKYGSATGPVHGPTFLAGLDFVLGAKTSLSLFADLTAPAVFPRIENLFRDGWTWDNTGGNNIMGAYRFGLALQFGL